MKLLFDQNLSPRLVPRLADLYPDSCHVSELGLERASDEAVWNHARLNGFLLVTKDADFSEFLTLRGFPLKLSGFGLATAPPRKWKTCSACTPTPFSTLPTTPLWAFSRCYNPLSKTPRKNKWIILGVPPNERRHSCR